MKRATVFLLLTLLCLSGFAGAETVESIEDEDEDFSDSSSFETPIDGEKPKTTESEAPKPMKTVPYVKPKIEGLILAETFDGDAFSRWMTSTAEKFTGTWKVVTRQIEAIAGDLGLRVMDGAKHHGIATLIPNKGLAANKGKDVIVSYEAKFEEGLQCGGGYLKLFHSSNLEDGDLHKFDNETPYVVMFGPDRCGSTNKVHLIIKHQNPVSGEWIEHHLQDSPHVPSDELSHVYGFHLKQDNSYEVFVDGKAEKKGSMLTDFKPAFTSEREVDDPNDKKPADWVDEKEIADPNSRKPDDWDEDAPSRIPDPTAVMPDGWLEEEPKLIADSLATQPEDWDEEGDGEWTAPLIANPACADAPGCGQWQAPLISNPAYKGKWISKKIPNPDYKGVWAPRKIPNPNFFDNKDPHAIADVDALGFELWTIQKGLLFDNILVSRAMAPVTAFLKETWEVRKDIEKSVDVSHMKPNLSSNTHHSMSTLQKFISSARLVAQAYPAGFATGTIAMALLLIFTLLKIFKMMMKKSASVVDTTKTVEKVVEKKSDDETSEGEEDEKEETEELKEKETKPATRKRAVKKD